MSSQKEGLQYILHKNLNALECEEFNETEFEESVWCYLTSAISQRVLDGCIYRNTVPQKLILKHRLHNLIKSEYVNTFDEV